MGRWQQAIEAAVSEVARWWTYGEAQTIAAIRALPEPPVPSEEELIEEMAVALVSSRLLRTSPQEQCRAILSVIRSHDCRKADEVRDALREVLECTAHSALNGDVSVHGVVATYDTVHRTDVLARAEKAAKT